MDSMSIFVISQVISGTQLPYSKEEKVKAERSLSVHLRISGVEPDRKKDWQTKSVKNNGENRFFD